MLSSIVRLSMLLTCSAALAESEGRYGPGVTDTEIKIGQTMPYSGPISMLSTIGRTEAAFFRRVNERGGVRGRKVNLVSLDDGYNPAKTVEQTRKLIEEENVLLLFSPQGTAGNMAIHKYVNAQKVPHLFLASSSSKWNDPHNFPWTMTGPRPTFDLEAQAFATYIIKTKPNARIAVLYQYDELGKDYLSGLKKGLGERAKTMLVAEASYQVTDPNIDAQIIALRASGADVLVSFSSPKFGAQAIRKVHGIGWKPMHLVGFPSSGVSTVLVPAGLEKAVGLISTAITKDPSDPQWQSDRDMLEYREFMRKYYPEGDPDDWSNVAGYVHAHLMIHVLEQCGDNLTRENIMRQANNLNGLELPLLLPGVRVATSPTDYLPVEQVQLVRFDGKRWVRFGDLIGKP